MNVIQPGLQSCSLINSPATYSSKGLGKKGNKKPDIVNDIRSMNVIQPGLEPGTYGLEGRCSNPTELLDPVVSGCKYTKMIVSAFDIFLFFHIV